MNSWSHLLLLRSSALLLEPLPECVVSVKLDFSMIGVFLQLSSSSSDLSTLSTVIEGESFLQSSSCISWFLLYFFVPLLNGDIFLPADCLSNFIDYLFYFLVEEFLAFCFFPILRSVEGLLSRHLPSSCGYREFSYSFSPDMLPLFYG